MAWRMARVSHMHLSQLLYVRWEKASLQEHIKALAGSAFCSVQ